MDQRYERAHRLMDASFGIGRDAAHQILRQNAEAKAVYDCAVRVIVDERPRSIDILRAELAKPVAREDGWVNPDHFDPWNIFEGTIYGSYSSDFDDMAILVLDNILNQRWGADCGETLAHEMFREMLCCAGLCNYGTSPRGCFPDYADGKSTAPLLAELLEKWREYRRVAWEEE